MSRFDRRYPPTASRPLPPRPASKGANLGDRVTVALFIGVVLGLSIPAAWAFALWLQAHV